MSSPLLWEFWLMIFQGLEEEIMTKKKPNFKLLPRMFSLRSIHRGKEEHIADKEVYKTNRRCSFVILGCVKKTRKLTFLWQVTFGRNNLNLLGHLEKILVMTGFISMWTAQGLLSNVHLKRVARFFSLQKVLLFKNDLIPLESWGCASLHCYAVLWCPDPSSVTRDMRFRTAPLLPRRDYDEPVTHHRTWDL